MDENAGGKRHGYSTEMHQVLSVLGWERRPGMEYLYYMIPLEAAATQIDRARLLDKSYRRDGMIRVVAADE